MSSIVEIRPSLRNDVSRREWERLLEDSSGATIFHTAEWGLVLKETYRDLNLRYILIEDKAGRYLAGLPFARASHLLFHALLSMPFGTYGGPLALRGFETDVSPFITTALQAVTRGVLPLSFCCTLYNTPVVLERAVQNAFPGGHRARVSTHLIDLEAGFDRLWSSVVDKETRTCARKAERNGVRVEERTTLEGAAVLHSLYKMQASAWGAKRVYPQRLLNKIVQWMPGRAKIWIATKGDAPVYGVLLFYFRDSVMAWLSGQNAEGRSVCASHLVYSEILKHACENGYGVFNFGASGQLQGVRYFKESFGGREYFYTLFTSESAVFKFSRKLKRVVAGA